MLLLISKYAPPEINDSSKSNFRGLDTKVDLNGSSSDTRSGLPSMCPGKSILICGGVPFLQLIVKRSKIGSWMALRKAKDEKRNLDKQWVEFSSKCIVHADCVAH
ncbi:Hypothetical predicted protein [Olea europaea subsp. europaea]|uniref:Uncharacterized protein n=1 Tax=Olea europaea subsp. europaea TaxID=158383 RepID=A0A8S0Q2U1_OLEEU|nr:Hypothetical predicted protein [Olea europaea subsp. europaea]